MSKINIQEVLQDVLNGKVENILPVIDYLNETQDWRRESLYHHVGEYLTRIENTKIDHKMGIEKSADNIAEYDWNARRCARGILRNFEQLCRIIRNLFWQELSGDVFSMFTQLSKELAEVQQWIKSNPEPIQELNEGEAPMDMMENEAQQG